MFKGGCSVVVDSLLIVTPIVGVCNCSMFCCTLLYVPSSIAIIYMGKRELVALLNLSSWRLVMIERLFLAVPRGCLRFVIGYFLIYSHTIFDLNNCINSTKYSSKISKSMQLYNAVFGIQLVIDQFHFYPASTAN